MLHCLYMAWTIDLLRFYESYFTVRCINAALTLNGVLP